MNNAYVDKPDELVSSGTIQQQQQQQKKCLHQRMFQNANGVTDRIAALLLQQRQQFQQQQQQHQQPQQTSANGRNYAAAVSVPVSGSAGTIVANVSSVGSTASGAGASNNVPIIPNQNGLVQQMNAALLAERYLLMDLVEGSTLYKCMDVRTHEELVCKVRLACVFLFDFRLSLF